MHGVCAHMCVVIVRVCLWHAHASASDSTICLQYVSLFLDSFN